MNVLPVFLVVSISAIISSSFAAPSNGFAGRYDGKWGPLMYRDADSGAIVDEGQGGSLGESRTALVTLKLPSGAGRRNSSVDFNPQSSTADVTLRLVTVFSEPEIRRRGKLAIYRADVIAKFREYAYPEDIDGEMLVRVLKRGSKAVIKRGNLRLLFPEPAPELSLNPVQLTGKLRGRK